MKKIAPVFVGYLFVRGLPVRGVLHLRGIERRSAKMNGTLFRTSKFGV